MFQNSRFLPVFIALSGRLVFFRFNKPLIVNKRTIRRKSPNISELIPYSFLVFIQDFGQRKSRRKFRPPHLVNKILTNFRT
jgi:hypothetical protein